ncbi:MAG: NAD(P)/FAD-dependent oxidoreductase [Granulosicoccus sp.]
MVHDVKMHVAVVGSGAAGLAAAWLLAKRHNVTLLEKDDRLGGHAHTATLDLPDAETNSEAAPDGERLKIDTGFIVYNEPSYPNMTRWFDAMSVKTEASDMSFAVSRDNGGFEYAGGPALGLLAQPGLTLRPRFWKMLRDLLRFYRSAPGQIPADSEQTLGDFLRHHRYNDEFVQDHLLPFGAAIWSTSKNKMLDYPAAAFIRFCSNHGLLQVTNRPQWRTVSGGSEQYVRAVEKSLGTESVITGFDVTRIRRSADGVSIFDAGGRRVDADHVVIAAHADQALACLEAPTPQEITLLGKFEYEPNLAILHTDESYLPKRRRAWCSWNYVERSGDDASQVSVSYWMNRLQNLTTAKNYIVTLNPATPPATHVTFRSQMYQHPVFTPETWKAQQELWLLQGQQRSWFCGSYFGSGFHEDAVQAGLAVAEQLGGLARPWPLEDPSPRIVVPSRNLSEYRGPDEAAA